MNFLQFLLEGEAAGSGAPSLLPTLLLAGGVIVLFYFVTIRPQKKQEKKDAEMRNNLTVGDEVTTIGGIIGKVVSIKGETFVLESTKDKTKIRFLKNAIRSVDVHVADLAAQAIAAKKEAEGATETPAEEATSTEETK